VADGPPGRLAHGTTRNEPGSAIADAATPDATTTSGATTSGAITSGTATGDTITSATRAAAAPETGAAETIESLKARARAGDRAALQRLRDLGFFAQQAAARTGFAASHAQTRLWVIDRLLEGSTAYNVPTSLLLDGPLDTGALQRALADVVGRHESLRTALRDVEGVLRQFVEEEVDVDVPIVDLRDRPDAEAAARQAAIDDAAQPFDLRRAPLLRARLLGLADDRHVLLLNLHHVVVDEVSSGVFVRDLGIAYRAHRAGQRPPFEPLRIQYKDFTAWQNARLDGPEIERHRQYWLRQLEGPLVPLPVPADRARPAVQTFRGEVIERPLEIAAFERLEALGRRRGTTLLMIVAAVLKALLHRYTHAEDIIIGTTTAGRDRAELADQIGFYVNALALRDRVSPADSFADLLDRVRMTATEAYEHQAYPFDRLVAELPGTRDRSRSPVFDVMLMVTDAPPAALDLDGLRVQHFEAGLVAAKYDLTFDLVRGPHACTLRLIYNADLFDRDRADRMVTHFERLIAAVVDRPDTPIGTLDFLPEDERRALIAFSQGPPRAYPEDRTLVDLFDDQVARTPDQIAITVPPRDEAPGRSLSYRTLGARAARLAHALAALGDLVPGEPVAVLAERGDALIVSLLGVMRAGAAYLPLDPSLPDARLSALIDDAGARVVVGRRLDVAHRLDTARTRLVDPDDDDDGDDVRDAPPAARRPAADDLAYLLYTSGSTGRPKGVEVAHRGFVNMILAQIDTFAICPEDVVLQFASCGFDASLSEIFMALLCGARLVCPDETCLKQPADLKQLIDDEQISVATLPPSYIRVLGFASLRSLRTLITAGEAAVPDDGTFAAPARRYWNAYGPTEFSVCATIGAVAPGAGASDRVPIGRPIANAEVLVLEPGGLALRPIGLTGEICLAGPGLARGYRGRPERTEAAFVDHPFRADARMYRTGDLGRWRSDGRLEFLGRTDDQVKVRGYRIEPAEIEAALRACPDVSEAVVVVRDATLIAYVLPRNTTLAVPALRTALGQQLPAYMVPDRIIAIDELPLTPSGKIDRARLAAGAGEQPVERPYTAPRTDTERQLAAIWMQVLEVDRIGVDDRFLDLGGNSLKAILMVSRVLKAMGTKITIRHVFEHDTIATLASALPRTTAAAPAAIPSIPIAADYAASHAQRRLWTIDRMGEAAGAYHIAGAMRIDGELDPVALQAAIEALAHRHESLRTTMVDVDGVPRQIVHERLPQDVEVADWRAGPRAEARVRTAIEADAGRPFDLACGPLFRMRLYRVDARVSILYLNLHHLISDGWSIEVLFRDVIRLYVAARDGRDAGLPALAIQYKDFSAWQIAWLSSPAADASLTHWRTALQGDLPVLDLPADRPRPAVRTFAGASLAQTLDAALSKQLAAHARAGRVSMATLWLSLFGTVLHRYTGACDLIVGMPATCREHPDLEHQIGLFVNTIPLRLRVDPEASFERFLARCGRDLGAALDHKDYPYDRLVEALDLRRDMSRNPLFDVALSVQEHRDAGDVPSHLRTSEFAFAARTSKFDLTLFASEDADGRWTMLFEYDTALFDAARVQRLGHHLEQLARAALDAPASPIAALALLDARERREVIERWNATETVYEREQSLVDLFRETARRVPDRPAVRCADRVLSYRELDVRSDRLAAAIVEARDKMPRESAEASARSTRPDDIGAMRDEDGGREGRAPSLIGVLLDRSERTPVVLLAILKAGAAYVPLDPAYPAARIAMILDDAGCDLVVAEPHYRDRVITGAAGVRCLDPGRDGEPSPDAAGASPVDPPRLRATASDLAYVMYTSGSTGTPKGTLIDQRAILRLVRHTNYVAIGEDDCFLQGGSCAFDASTFEIWGALLNGACVCLPPSDDTPDGPEMRRWLDTYRPTILFLTTSLFNQMAEFDAAMFGGVRTLLTGGERVSPAHVNQVREACAATRVLHVYGPTENTTFSLWHPVDRRYDDDIPLGRPIANSRIYVVDANLRPVPVGIPGELLVAGDGVALGYLHRPALTAERFIPDPFVAHGRAYRTGDRGSWRADGTIAFLGRVDEQVKVRGYRIEPAEIEAEMRRVPGLHAAIVIPRRTSVGTVELLGYFTSDEAIDAAGVRERLRLAMPGYMVPGHLVRLPRMPLTPNGKVDKQRLPAPESIEAPAGVAIEAPRGDVEAAIAGTWADVLDRSAIGRHDNYFDLGGDSIRAIQIASRLRRAGWSLKVRDLFLHPSVAALAAIIERAPDASSPTAPHGDDDYGEAPLAPVQAWFFARDAGERHHFNQSVLLRLPARIDDDALQRAIASIWDRHALLHARYRVAAHGGVEQVIARATVPAIEIVDCTHAADPNAALNDHADRVQRSFDLARGPLARVVRYRLADGDRLLLAIHHLVVDTVSWRILLEDLDTAYRQACRGDSVDPGPRTASYRAWTLALARHVRDGGFDEERAYWAGVEQADGGTLPYDIDDASPGCFGDAETATITLTRADTIRLLERTHRAYGTETHELILTALGRALRQWHGGDRTRVTIEGHGREMDLIGLDVSRTVGWFTALYPCLLDVSGPDLAMQVKRVKETLRRVPHGGVGYLALRGLGAEHAATAATAPAMTPVVTPVSFNFLGHVDQPGGAGGDGFAFAAEPAGREIAAAAPRMHHLDVSGLVIDGRLQMVITFSRRRYQGETIERLASSLGDEIRTVIAHCESRLAPERTPADFAIRTFELDEYAAFLQRADLQAADVEEVYPLAPMQEGLLYRHRLHPASPAYHLQMDFDMRGPIDSGRYRQAWSEIVRRHAVLRTAFFDEDLPRPVQVVLRDRAIEFVVEDLSEQSPDERAASIARYKATELARRFDPGHGPLWRVAVLRTGAEQHRVLWSYHHILIDGWSLGLLYRDLMEVYASLVAGREPARPAPRSFAMYVEWVRRQDMQRGLAFWSEYLRGVEEPIALPKAPDAALHKEYAYEEQTFEADATLTEAIASSAAQLQVTPYTIIQTAWATVVSRYTRSSDVLFGSVVSGRPPGLDAIEETVGLFINTLPTRVRVDPARTFAETAQALQRDLLQTEEFTFVPLAEIQTLAPAGRALFDHLLVFENYAVDRQVADGSIGAASGLAVAGLQAHDESDYDLNLVIVPGPRVQFRISYNAHAHPADWIARFAAHLLTTLAQATHAPDRPLAAIDIVPVDERHLLLHQFREPAATTPAAAHAATVLDLFAAQVARVPDAIAVQHGAARLTYRALAQLSDRFACYLRAKQPIAPDDRIALLMERSDRLIVALLGILKAGAAYVPIDPGYPRERIRFLLADAGAALVVTERVHAGLLTATGPAPALVIGDVWRDIMQTPVTVLPPPIPAQLAYVIYTSGSTGQPKGCQIEHRNLAHYLDWASHHYFDDPSHGTFGLYSSLSFDLTVTSLFLPLIRGRALTVFPQAREVHDLLRDMFEPGSGIDAVKLTPSHISLIPELGLSSTDVAVAVVGGEALTADHVRILHRLNPRMAVFNEYGPTETTVGCVVKRVDRDAPAMTIGRPIDGARLTILDEIGRLVPIGVPGEIHVGGHGVGRGYLGRPDLTRERFPVDPFARDASPEAADSRHYRTGDLGRWLPDGEIEYLGRLDDQVKIRGHRIEPSEIEAAIRRTGRVEHAAVIARPVGGHAESALVAYVTGHPDVGALRADLAAVLPAPFLPAHVVVLDALPLTPHGKLDRRALPDPETSRPADAVASDAPRTDTEQRVAAIWRDVLGVDRIGRHDKFFALGGHSLKATQIVSRVLKQTGVRISLRAFFQDATVAALATQIDQATARHVPAAIAPAAIQPDYALSYAQHRLWLLHQLPGGAVAYNMPFAFMLEGPALDTAALRQAFDAIVARHEALRTAFVIVDGEPRQRIIAPEAVAAVPFREIDLRHASPAAADAEAHAITETDTQTLFDLTSPPLLRVAVVRMPPRHPHGGQARQVVILTMHHIVGDGWSMVVLAREISALYDALSAGRPAALTPLAIQYKDYSEWQNRRDWGEQEAWWLRTLSGMPERLDLPYDFPPAAERDFRGAVAEHVLQAPVVAALRALAADRGATLAHAVLALFHLVLYRLSGQADVCVGMSVANRNHRELEGLIGFFVNLVPVRVRITEPMEFATLLDQVARMATAALDRQDYPFDLLVRRMQPERVSNRQPLINVVYAFQQFDDLRVSVDATDVGGRASADPAPDAGATRAEAFEVPFRTSKFDLTLFVIDRPDDGTLRVVLEYDSTLFHAERARQLVDLLIRFAGVAAADGARHS
jgi:amino acid adenylation domain-containing protein/non-ribosomal peptide synthase protein (TIGR01720 family)